VPVDRAFHDRFISTERDPAYLGCPDWWLSHRDGLADVHSALPRFDAGFTILLYSSRFSFLVHDLQPSVVILRIAGALAFYLINLQDFAAQTSLSIARDRVVGILLGLS